MVWSSCAIATSSVSAVLAFAERGCALSLDYAFFDGVKVGRVGRQIEQVGAGDPWELRLSITTTWRARSLGQRT